jgi:hypothetical protein
LKRWQNKLPEASTWPWRGKGPGWTSARLHRLAGLPADLFSLA